MAGCDVSTSMEGKGVRLEYPRVRYNFYPAFLCCEKNTGEDMDSRFKTQSNE